MPFTNKIKSWYPWEQSQGVLSMSCAEAACLGICRHHILPSLSWQVKDYPVCSWVTWKQLAVFSAKLEIPMDYLRPCVWLQLWSLHLRVDLHAGCGWGGRLFCFLKEELLLSLFLTLTVGPRFKHKAFHLFSFWGKFFSVLHMTRRPRGPGDSWEVWRLTYPYRDSGTLNIMVQEQNLWLDHRSILTKLPKGTAK